MSEAEGKLAFKGTGVASGSGHANGHALGSKDTVGGRILKESGGFFLAEAASIATGLGVVAVADRLIPKAILDGAATAVSKVAIEPFLENIEGIRDKVCKLEECQTDTSIPREERAQAIARTLIIFGAAYASSMAVKLITRRKLNEVAGIIEEKPAALKAGASLWEKFKHSIHMTPQEKLIFAADEGVHYGSLWLLNSPLAPFTDDMIKDTSKMLQKVTGMDEKKSRELSDMFWIWDMPNILGGLTAMGVIAGNHTVGLATKGWLGKVLANKAPAEPVSHVERLAAKTATQQAAHHLATT